MKVNLLIDNPADVRSGYLNIDPYALADGDRIHGDLSDLSHSVDDAEAEEIVANDVLDYYPGAVGTEVFKNWVKKLAHGGTLTVSVVDLKEVARAVCGCVLTLEEANDLLHGKQEKEWDTRKASYTVSRLAEVFEALGLTILHKRVRNYRAVVTGRRP